jgi:hypothetical protein
LAPLQAVTEVDGDSKSASRSRDAVYANGKQIGDTSKGYR